MNDVEWLWQALYDTITHNHQCRSMWQLLQKVRHFMETASPFPGGKHGLAKVSRYQGQLFSREDDKLINKPHEKMRVGGLPAVMLIVAENDLNIVVK